MASPQVAGAAALLLQARPGTRAEDVRTILQNTADPRPVLGTTLTDAVHRQGAGLLDVDDARRPTPASRRGRSRSAKAKGLARLTITNASDHTRTYALSHLPALATSNNTPSYTFTAFADRPATVTFSDPTVTVAAGASTAVTVSIAPHATLPALATYGGYVVVDDGEGASRAFPTPASRATCRRFRSSPASASSSARPRADWCP